jgi:hypothetical protein
MDGSADQLLCGSFVLTDDETNLSRRQATRVTKREALLLEEWQPSDVIEELLARFALE